MGKSLKNPHQVNPLTEGCVLIFRKLNDLQPEVHHTDSQTGGNISLVPLPKIDKMYVRLKGAKYFTHFRFTKWVLSHWVVRKFKS